MSGDAEGGDARKKRAYDAYTAGGNAYSGGSGDTSSGNIINEADDEATITNTGPGTSKYFVMDRLQALSDTFSRHRRHCW